MTRTALLCLGVMACAHAHHGSAPLVPRPAYEVNAFTVPRGDGQRELAACSPGVPLVAHRGGVVAAGANVWVIKPGQDPITSVACDEAGDLFFVRGRSLVMHGESGERNVELPSGKWELVGTPVAAVWLYGTLDDGRSAILHFDPDNGLGIVHVGQQPLRAVAAVGTDAVAGVLDRDLVFWRGGEAVDAGEIGPGVDGLAVDEHGALYVSASKGVVRVQSLDTPAEMVIKNVHGPLRMRGEELFLFWRDGSTILRISPHVEELDKQEITVAAEKPSIFREGPAQGRRQSMDVGASYVALVQTGAATLTDEHPVYVAREQLADAATLQGVNLEFNMGPGTSRHLVLAPMSLTIAGGSAPVKEVTPSPTAGAGMAVTSATVGLVGARIPIGYRIPMGYFSLSFGSGAEVSLLVADAWKDSSGVLHTISAGSLWIPAWARFEYEPSCAWGLFVQGGYSQSIDASLPSYSMFGAGLNYRFMRRCN